MYGYYLTIVLAPLAAAIVAGLAGHKIGRAGAHWVTIVAVGISCLLSLVVLKNMFWGGAAAARQWAPEAAVVRRTWPPAPCAAPSVLVG